MLYNSGKLIEPSHLNTPVKLIYDIDTTQIAPLLSADQDYILSLEGYAQYLSDDHHSLVSETTLFTLSLKNLTYYFKEQLKPYYGHLLIEYDSESGLLFLLNGDNESLLLNTLTTSSQGRKILDSMLVNKYNIIGQFNDYSFNWNNLQFTIYLKVTNNDSVVNLITRDPSTGQDVRIYPITCQVITRGRTNII